MLVKQAIHKAAATAVVMVAGAATAQAATIGFALDGTGSNLLQFDVNTPGAISTVTIGNGLAAIDAIDFRPATGDLIAYSDATDEYFTLNTTTGALTTISVPTPALNPTNTPVLDLDWNPTIDRMRVVTQSDQNIVFNPDNGATVSGGAGPQPLAYGAGDANNGANPTIVANGYTNSISGAATTVQYALDSDLNVLVTLANNAGTLTTVGSEGLDFGPLAGLDITSGVFDGPGGTDTAYALLNDQATNESALYTLNLTTGAATLVGDFGGLQGLTGLAVFEEAAAVPTPASFLLLAFGGLLLRRRQK